MSKIIIVGTDPALRDLFGNISRQPHDTGSRIEVEYLEKLDIAQFARKRPHTVVMDVRVSNPLTIEMIARLKMRTHQPSLMLQVTPQQQEDDAWTQLLPASRTVLFTSETSKIETRKLLESLLAAPSRRPWRAASLPVAAPKNPAQESSKTSWRELNDRRIDLIYKQFDGKLTDAEQRQLADLQRQADQKVGRSRTLDFDALSNFNAQARKLSGHG